MRKFNSRLQLPATAYLLILGLAFMIPRRSHGQSSRIEVSGTITDAVGKPVTGVSVMEKNTHNGTISNSKGQYLLMVSRNAILVFSYAGMLPVEKKVDGLSQINITLQQSLAQLEDVVVVGYGTQRKQDVTGSIAVVDMKKLEKRPSPNIEELLQGNAPGILIKRSSGAPGGNLSIQIRGASSINAGTEPLYVIDGMPIYNDNEDPSGSSYGTYSSTNAMVSLNPSDIESIQVLKDASATAIYGSRGSNGVIIITTKKGARSNGTQVQYNGYYGQQQLVRKLDLMNGEQQAAFFNDWAKANGTTEPFPTPSSIGAGTDWQDQVFRKGAMQNHELSVAKRKDGQQFYASANYFDQAGIVINSSLKRYSFRTNAEQELGRKFTFTENLSFSRTINNGVPIANVGAGNVRAAGERAYVTSPTIPVKDENGDYVDIWYGASKPENPVASLNGTYSKITGDNLLGNLALEYTILPGLRFRSMLGVNLLNRSLEEYYPKSSTYIGGILGGLGQLSTRSITEILNENTLRYSKKFKEHQIELLGGFTWQTNRDKSWSAQTAGYPDDRLGVNAPGSATSVPIVDAGTNEWSLASFISRLNYQFRNKYLLTATVRADGSSKFGAGNKWGYFPSVAVGYRLSEDPFIKNLHLFDDLKLRGSYGLTGNQQIGTYRSLARIINTVNYIFDNQLVSGSRQISLANGDLKWEKAAQWDIGLDASLLNRRISFTFDIYQKNTSDLLFNIDLPSNSGYSSALSNTGSLSNRGWEAAITAQLLTGTFQWDINANYSHNNAKMTSLGRSGSTSLFVGYAPGVSLWYIYEGVFHNQDEIDRQTTQPSVRPGDARYLDTDGSGNINANDKVIMGVPNPKHIFGINNSFRFKGLELAIFLQSALGQKSARLAAIFDPSSVSSNKSTDLLNRWTPDNPNSDIPAAGYRNRLSPSTYDMNDLSYIKLRNIRLGYTIPAKLRGKLAGAYLYLSGENLITITNYYGYDPDGGSNYPPARTVTAGINIQF